MLPFRSDILQLWVSHVLNWENEDACITVHTFSDLYETEQWFDLYVQFMWNYVYCTLIPAIEFTDHSTVSGYWWKVLHGLRKSLMAHWPEHPTGWSKCILSANYATWFTLDTWQNYTEEWDLLHHQEKYEIGICCMCHTQDFQFQLFICALRKCILLWEWLHKQSFKHLLRHRELAIQLFGLLLVLCKKSYQEGFT